MPSKKFLKHLLPGDHITSLAQGPSGNLWLGTWRDGYAKINTHTGAILQSRLTPGLSKLDGYIAQLATMANGTLAIGRYGFGVSTLKYPDPKLSKNLAKDSITQHNRKILASYLRIARPLVGNPLPAPAKPPGKFQLNDVALLFTKADIQAKHIQFPYARFLRNDWRTQGDWTARYGREYALLCTAHYDLDFHVIARNYGEEVYGVVGPHHRKFESIREWESEADTDNPRSLYIPQIGHRRQTNWDDHGETYPITYQGPDIWIRVHLNNPGLYRLSLYCFNKDGHSATNRQRDWPIEVYPLAHRFYHYVKIPLLSARAFAANRVAFGWAMRAMAAKPLAETRVVNFWNPVYTRFVLAGPGQYMVRMVRNSSLNTELSGIFIDRADVPRTPFDNRAMTGFGGVNYCRPAAPLAYESKHESLISVWDQAKHAFGGRGFNVRWFARVLCYRYAVAHHAPSALQARWRWRLDIWTLADRHTFDNMMNKGFWAMLKGWKGLKEVLVKDGDFQPNSGELGHG